MPTANTLFAFVRVRTQGVAIISPGAPVTEESIGIMQAAHTFTRLRVTLSYWVVVSVA